MVAVHLGTLVVPLHPSLTAAAHRPSGAFPVPACLHTRTMTDRIFVSSALPPRPPLPFALPFVLGLYPAARTSSPGQLFETELVYALLEGQRTSADSSPRYPAPRAAAPWSDSLHLVPQARFARGQGRRSVAATPVLDLQRPPPAGRASPPPSSLCVARLRLRIDEDTGPAPRVQLRYQFHLALALPRGQSPALLSCGD